MQSGTRRGGADGKLGLRSSEEGGQDKEESHFQIGFDTVLDLGLNSSVRVTC